MPSQKVLDEKKQIVSGIVEQFKTAVSGVFVDYCGLTVEQDTQLRNSLREAGVEYKVIKNSLIRFAAKEVGFDELDPILNGPTSLAISMTDEVAPAKVIAEFAKKCLKWRAQPVRTGKRQKKVYKMAWNLAFVHIRRFSPVRSFPRILQNLQERYQVGAVKGGLAVAVRL